MKDRIKTLHWNNCLTTVGISGGGAGPEPIENRNFYLFSGAYSLEIRHMIWESQVAPRRQTYRKNYNTVLSGMKMTRFQCVLQIWYCVNVLVCVCMRVHVCEDQRLTSSALIGVPTEPRAHWLGYTGESASPRGSPVSAAPALGVHCCSLTLCGFQEFKLRPSGFTAVTLLTELSPHPLHFQNKRQNIKTARNNKTI